ncbi:MAG: sigma-70 family RNA polymerase sigma factor [Gemmatimonadaceae bacterium]|nr:sigma-70 family RNA polymerase sigma factor [Gemmatimonadaceae bacterium]
MNDSVPPADARDVEFARDALPYMDDVYRFAYSLTRNAADADDLVQETYLRAFRSWHTFQPGSDARRWLFTICRNAFLRSREKLRHEVDVEDSDMETLVAVMNQGEMRKDGSDQLLSRVDLAPALTKALDELAEPFRSTVILVDVEDQSYDAASEVLGVPVGTVRSRLFRGRRQLQEKLRAYARDAGFASAGNPAQEPNDV